MSSRLCKQLEGAARMRPRIGAGFQWYNTYRIRIGLRHDQEADPHRERRGLPGAASGGWPGADQPLSGGPGAAPRRETEARRRLPGNGGRREPGVGGAGMGGVHHNRVPVVPITSNVSRLYPSEALITVGGERRKAMADQIATVSKQRLEEPLGKLSEKDMNAVEGAIRIQLGLK